MKFFRFLKNLWVDTVWQRISREYIIQEVRVFTILALIASVITGAIYLLGKISIALGIPEIMRIEKPSADYSPLVVGLLTVVLIAVVIAVLAGIKQFYSYCRKIWQRS